MAKKHDAVIAGTNTVYLPPLPGKAKKGTTIWKEWAKSAVIELLKQGLTIADICETLGVTRSWYDQQRARDKEWAKRVDETRAGKWTADWPDLTGMSYKEFAKTYLGWEVYPHQAPIIEALEDPNVNRILVTGFPECIPMDAEILTSKGWRGYGEIAPGDLVLGDDGGTLRWTEVTKVHYYEAAETVRLRGQGFDFTVTPNHRWVTERAEGSRLLVPTNELNTYDKILVSEPAEGGSLDVTPDEAALIAWLITDGSYKKQVGIWQKKPEYRQEIEELLDRLGIDWAYYESGFYHIPQEWWNSSVCKQYIHGDLEQFVLGLTREARAAFFEAALHAEGWQLSERGWGMEHVDDHRFDAIKLAGFLEGYNVMPQGRRNRGVRETHAVSFSKHHSRKKAHRLVQEPAGIQPVWSVTTGLGSYVMRQGDFISLTGNSGKSTHVSLGYALYAMCLNPDIRIAIVSKSQVKAEDLLHRIKRYLTEPHLYENAERNLIEDFNGFEPPRGRFRWDAKQITIRQRQSGERDPTVQALGIGAQIYGTRIDLLILDDALTLENQLTEDRRDKITSWFLQEAMSRVHRGRVIVCGTRIHPFDNYNEWHQAWKDDPHYRRIKIPAIVLDENGEEQSTWPEYWPLDGGEVWDDVLGGYRFQKGMRQIRDEVMSLGEQRWRLVYQQEDVQDTEAIFTREAIEKAMDLGANRSLGQVFPEEILVLGVDPAVSGRAAAVLVAYNPKTRVRTIVDIFVGENLGATGIRDRLMRYFWEKYRPQRTVIEVNYAPTIMGDEALKLQAQSYGTVLTPHYTLSSGHKKGSKWDEEYGVAALAPLVNHGLYVLPSKTPDDRKRLEPLIQDMVAFPFSDVQDALMALWFAEGEMRYLATVPYTPEQVAENRQLPPYLARRMSRSYRRTA